jgi:hypothetical protein
MAVGVFAGVPVMDYTSAVKWYELLLGAEASFYPNEVEAVWQLAEDRYVYIVEDQERAGGGVNMIWVDDPVAEAGRIAERGDRAADPQREGAARPGRRPGRVCPRPARSRAGREGPPGSGTGG